MGDVDGSTDGDNMPDGDDDGDCVNDGVGNEVRVGVRDGVGDDVSDGEGATEDPIDGTHRGGRVDGNSGAGSADGMSELGSAEAGGAKAMKPSNSVTEQHTARAPRPCRTRRLTPGPDEPGCDQPTP